MKFKVPLFIRTYNSPFKPLKLRWYFGKVAIGVPYFLPRKWVKFTYVDALKKATEDVNNVRLIVYGMNPTDIVKNYMSYSKPVPKKMGFDFRDVGWKTKWTSDDYRFEFSPIVSFVFFRYQIVLTFVAVEASNYWESFLFYYFETDKKLSQKERIEDCKKRFPNIWTTHKSNGEKTTINYYDLILK